MGIVSKFLVLAAVNGAALYLVNAYVPGFTIDLSLEGFLTATLVLALLNFFIKPILKILLAPLLFLTFGLVSFAINAFTLYLLDYLLPTVTISGLIPLLYATILFSFLNLVIGFFIKIL